jgi:hypothetical protein
MRLVIRSSDRYSQVILLACLYFNMELITRASAR